MNRKHLGILVAGLAVLAVAALALPPLLHKRAPEAVHVIRIGAPVVSGTTSTQTYFGSVGVARVKHLFEREFEKDGIKVEFVGFPNGPMVAQALANNQIDFAGHGDMISIIARAGGAKTRLILPSQRFSNAYLVVPPGSPIHSVEDLRGKRVAYTKGNYIHLQTLRILEEHGLKESDIRSVNLAPAAVAAAVRAGQVDAVFANADILLLVEQGLARVAYSTRGRPDLGGRSAVLVRDQFATENPELTARVVKVLVQASRYASEEQRRDEVIDIWATGRAVGPLQTENEGVPMAEIVSPLLDPFYIEGYRRTEADVQKLGLLRGEPFEIEDWVDRTYLDKALKDLGLEHYWTPRPAGPPSASAAAPASVAK